MRIKITLSLFCAVVTALCVLRPVVLAGGGGKKDPPKRSAPDDELKKLLDAAPASNEAAAAPPADGAACADGAGGGGRNLSCVPPAEKKKRIMPVISKAGTWHGAPNQEVGFENYSFIDCTLLMSGQISLQAYWRLHFHVEVDDGARTVAVYGPAVLFPETQGVLHHLDFIKAEDATPERPYMMPMGMDKLFTRMQAAGEEVTLATPRLVERITQFIYNHQRSGELLEGGGMARASPQATPPRTPPRPRIDCRPAILAHTGLAVEIVGGLVIVGCAR